MKLNIDENIEEITKTIESLNKEILRMEGSLRVFKQFKTMGLHEIDINNKESLMQKTEVIDEDPYSGNQPPS
jgi:predicted  nucleic acid-binding Zn-ribbon protein